MKYTNIKIIKNKIIKNNQGDIKKFLTKNSKEYAGFGECYFSEIKPGSTKPWKKNLTTFQMIAVVSGRVKFFLMDDRILSKKIKRNFILDDSKNFNKIIIPKNIWYSFKNLSYQKSILFNFINIEHAKGKIIRKQN